MTLTRTWCGWGVFGHNLAKIAALSHQPAATTDNNPLDPQRSRAPKPAIPTRSCLASNRELLTSYFFRGK